MDYNRETVKYFVKEELELNVIEKPEYRRCIFNTFGPQFTLLSCKELVNELTQCFVEKKLALKETLSCVPGVICLSSELWSSNEKHGYMSITTHWVSNYWKLNKRIISFAMLPTPYHVVASVAIYNNLLGWNIYEKIGAVTFSNNCNSNGAVNRYDESCEVMNQKLVKCWKNLPLVRLFASCMYPRLKLNKLEMRIIQNSRDDSLITECPLPWRSILELRLPTLSEFKQEFKKRLVDFFDEYKETVNKNSGGNTELQRYFGQRALNVSKEKPFDVLKWWQSQEGSYPVLSKMARDLLTIPISSVSFKSGFSGSEKVLSNYRRRLSPKTVEALVFLKD